MISARKFLIEFMINDVTVKLFEDNDEDCVRISFGIIEDKDYYRETKDELYQIAYYLARKSGRPVEEIFMNLSAITNKGYHEKVEYIIPKMRPWKNQYDNVRLRIIDLINYIAKLLNYSDMIELDKLIWGDLYEWIRGHSKPEQPEK